jgi:hypothetical protein
VTLLQDLPQNHLVVLLASRFNLNEGGHFYWYTKEIVEELKTHHPNYLVLSPPLTGHNLPDFIDARWEFIEDFSAWGHDIGEKSPRKLVERILSALDNQKGFEDITFLSYESSFSMLVALLEIQRKLPRTQVSVTLLDHGFWLKFLSTRIPLVRLLVLNFMKVLKNANHSFALLHPSLSQVASFTKLLGLRVFSFSPISAFSRYTAQPLNVDPEVTRLLVLPWSVDLDHVAKFIKSVSTSIGMEFSIQVHFKTYTDLNYFREQIEPNIFNKIEYSAGVLSLEAYVSLFKRSDLTWIPYTDIYHQVTGSGRACDSLALGCPLIIDEKSDLARMVSNFPLVYFCPDSNTDWISRFKDQITEERRDFYNYTKRRRELESLSAELFSPLNAINSLLQPFDARLEKGKNTFRYVNFLAFEVLYYLAFYYSKFDAATRWLGKFPRIIRKD